MSEAQQPGPAWEDMSAEEKQSALFANLVMQQTNAALLMLGQVPHPDTGKSEVDLDGASLFIDTLEMLQAKTRSHLGKQEDALLKQSLTMLRMAFVEKVKAGAATKKPEAVAPASKDSAAPAQAAAAAPPAEESESKKKFTKKY
jgi:hypothetical protein